MLRAIKNERLFVAKLMKDSRAIFAKFQTEQQIQL